MTLTFSIMRGKLNMELDTFKLKPKFTIVLKQ